MKKSIVLAIARFLWIFLLVQWPILSLFSQAFDQSPDAHWQLLYHFSEGNGPWQAIKIPNSTYYPAFGWSLTNVGDLNRDGTDDLCGFMRNDNANLMLLFMLAPDGQIREVKVTDLWEDTRIGDRYERLGSAVVGLGDLDGNGWPDLAVADNCHTFKPGAECRGSILILYLDQDQQIKSTAEIDRDSPNFELKGGSFQDFGQEMESVGDLDGDGVPELAVYSTRNPDEAADLGQVHILFLNRDGSVRQQTIFSGFDREIGLRSQYGPRINGSTCCQAYFGHSMASLGDINGDGTGDLAVAEMMHAYKGEKKITGKVWIVMLRADGSIKKVKEVENPHLDDPWWARECFLRFGHTLHGVGDVDGNGIGDFVVQEYRKGVPQNEDYAYGRIHLYFLEKGGSILKEEYLDMPGASFGSGTTWFRAQLGDSLVHTLICNRYGYDTKGSNKTGQGISRGHNGEMFFFRPPGILPPEMKVDKDTIPKVDGGLVEDGKPERKEEIALEWEVVNDFLTLRIWDDQRVDGDVVSLEWNGKWVLQDYTLQREIKTLYLTVEPGRENRLFLVAENLGAIPPNTATFSLDDGKTVKQFKLTSDFDVSRGILVKRK